MCWGCAVSHSYGPATWVLYSLAGMLSASVGGVTVSLAKFAWDRVEHLIFRDQQRLQPVRTRAVHNILGSLAGTARSVLYVLCSV